MSGAEAAAEDVEYEPLNVTVKDDNGKARIQTSPIPGLSKQGESTLIVDICSDCIKISVEVTDKKNTSKKKTHHSRIRLSQDIRDRCKVTKKEIEKDGRLVIHVEKKEPFKLAKMVNIRR
ncbi:uncharacterized protein LOC135479560 [Liolophura sinensis]|uniref:uncharacterized protein LOC135479560 n=1 Tax=Liolophura sinensis TaxID=3198878 RepID=UPI003158D203